MHIQPVRGLRSVFSLALFCTFFCATAFASRAATAAKPDGPSGVRLIDGAAARGRPGWPRGDRATDDRETAGRKTGGRRQEQGQRIADAGSRPEAGRPGGNRGPQPAWRDAGRDEHGGHGQGLGATKEIRKQDDLTMRLYEVAMFPHVEASCRHGKVLSIVIRLEKDMAPEKVAQGLGLAKIMPVLIQNELGEFLGQSYPERGVLFLFEPGATSDTASMKVNSIVLEPISAEPFVLRRTQTSTPVRT